LRSNTVFGFSQIELAADAVALAIMTMVGSRVVGVSVHIFRDDDLRQLEYLWMPSIVAGGFLYFLNWALLIANLYGAVPASVILNILEVIDLVVCLVVAFGMFRFATFVGSYERKKKEAQITARKLEQIVKGQ
jgi:uncharacterized membrane protein